MIDVLMYLFENYMEKNCDLKRDHDELLAELQVQGFNLSEIHNAFHWLDGLSELQNSESLLGTNKLTTTRVFTKMEVAKLTVEGTGFIHFLTEINILDPITRETVIDRAMALDGEEIDISRIKWVVLMVLFNSPNHESELALMEEFILTEKDGGLH